MASTPEGRRLTEAHRLAQQQVRDDFLTQFIALWVLLDSARLDETGPGWVDAVVRLIQDYRLDSAELSTRYFDDFRAVEAPSSVARPRVSDRPQTPPPPAAPLTGRPPRHSGSDKRPSPEVIPHPRESRVRFDVNEGALHRPGDRRARVRIDTPPIDWSERDRAVRVSLTVVGPIGQKSQIKKGRSEKQARDVSFVEAAGVATRHVLTGGRQSLLTLVEGDTQALGWVRVTDGDPCYFCAMLASRGPVYKKESFAESDPRFVGPGTVKVHDHCACTLEAVYSRGTLWPGRAAEFRRMWREHIQGRFSGKDAVREWRRVYERIQREAQRETA